MTNFFADNAQEILFQNKECIKFMESEHDIEHQILKDIVSKEDRKRKRSSIET